MFDNFDDTTLQIIEKAKEYSKNKYKLGKVGTEAFLYVMFSDEESLCRILLEEYRVSLLEIEELMKDYVIIRSSNEEYTEKLKEVFKTAGVIAKDNGSKKVYEEHLLFALLMIKNTIFIHEIEDLNLNSVSLLEDLKEFFNLENNKEIDNYSTNLTELAKDNKLNKLIGRENYLNRMEIILKRKNKNNILLVGSAGVGKTALVEGLALKLLDTNQQIISINISSIVANTKYRGDFESRINKILKELTEENAILFIDEIHTIMGAGSTDNTLDLANILKPYLARSNFRCIGATTIEEYQKTIVKDKALTRRFQPIFVNEPTMEETKEILLGIKDDYSTFHNVSIDNIMIDHIINASKKITNRKLPDKAIDLLDEALSIANIEKKECLSLNHLEQALSNITGLAKGVLNYQFIYNELEPYYLDNYLGISNKNNLVSIKFSGDENNLKLLLKELKLGFGIQDEMVLDLDLTNFTDAFSISSLFGAPAGYVGYEDGGIISEHLAKYPSQIFVLRNLFQAHSEIRLTIEKMIKENNFYDKKGRSLSVNHAVFIITSDEEKENEVGFIKKTSRINKEYDIELGNKNDLVVVNPYIEIFKTHGFNISYDDNDYTNHQIEYKKSFVNLLENYQAGKYFLSYNNELGQIEIKNL